MKEIPRVVFDTNIFFSAAGWQGNPHRCIQAARQGKCFLLTCEAILAELAEKLQLKRGFDASKAAATADEIRALKPYGHGGDGLRACWYCSRRSCFAIRSTA